MPNVTRLLALFILGPLLMLSACTDHHLNEVGQPRLRLKRTVSTSPGFPGTTEFVYDAQGRQAAYVYLGDRATFTYNATNRVQSILFSYVTTSDITGEQTSFSYTDATRQVQAELYNLITVNGQYTPRTKLKTATYTFDDQNLPTQLVEYTPTAPNPTSTYFTVVAGNLIRTLSQTANSTNQTTSDYSYDTHPNPFYGLIGPGITDARRFSQNNVVKTVFTYSSGTAAPSQSELAIQYEYNPQGLPTKAVSGNTTLTFEYEPY